MPASIQYRENVSGPSVIGPKLSGSAIARPEASSSKPGLSTKKSAPLTNIARRLIQPAFHGAVQPARLWWLTRPSRSLRKRTGTSAVRRSMRTDFSTISDAYSQDCDESSIRANASRVIARIPQWMSENELPYSRFRIHVVTGVPK